MFSDDLDIDFDNTENAFSHLSDLELKKAYWMFGLMNKNWLVKAGSLLTRTALKLHLPIKFAIKKTVFQHFCGGETIRECRDTVLKLGQKGIGTILDYSVEGEESEANFDETLKHLLETVRVAADSENIPFAVFKVTGLARTSLLEKRQAKVSFSKGEEAEWDRISRRILHLCQSAHDQNVRIFFDAEESWIQDTIDHFSYEMMKLFNKREAVVYNTFQFYRSDMLRNYRDACQSASEQGYHLGAKLVRGAYMEKEASRAKMQGYSNPIHPNKEAVDRDYNEAILYSLNRLSFVAICLGTHNENSCRLCMSEMKKRKVNLNDKRIYFAQLLGMSDNISFNVALAGYNVAKYVPFGPIEAVMPYLFRRANENTAIAGQSSREFLLIRKELLRRKRRP